MSAEENIASLGKIEENERTSEKREIGKERKKKIEMKREKRKERKKRKKKR